MNLLLIHQNFPGQFRRLALSWASHPTWNILGIGRDTAPGMKSVRWLSYKLARQPHAHQHSYLLQMENAVLHGQAVARALMALKREGYRPDVILAHPGWGETLYVRDVFPDVRLIHFCEWFYGTSTSDVGFDPEFPSTADHQAKLRTWNALHLLNLSNCDVGISPTEWQRGRHPIEYQKRIHVAHEGIDADLLAPNLQARFNLPSGQTFQAGDPVITYVARNLEPYRGFHIFMRALEKAQKTHKTCHAIIVGGDDVSYGTKPANAPHWRAQMLSEVKLDPYRTHFLGRVQYEQYCKILQVSAAHVYLTYPFVLSWSALEAMASGCLVVGSRTPPVEEVIIDGRTGLLVDFFDSQDLADRLVEALERPEKIADLRQNAAKHAREHYSVEQGARAYQKLIEGTV